MFSRSLRSRNCTATYKTVRRPWFLQLHFEVYTLRYQSIIGAKDQFALMYISVARPYTCTNNKWAMREMNDPVRPARQRQRQKKRHRQRQGQNQKSKVKSERQRQSQSQSNHTSSRWHGLIKGAHAKYRYVKVIILTSRPRPVPD